MTRKSPFSFIGLDGESDPLYCPWCEKVGKKNKLGPRVYEEYENSSDSDNWLQCYSCGRKIPIYETKEEGEYGPVVDMLDSPFDSGSEFKSTEPRKKKKRVARNRLQQENDPDIAAEQGNVNIVYDSQGNY